MKIINSKYIIACDDDVYKIGNIVGKVPKGHDCILDGWHLRNGKVIKKGKVIFVVGNGMFGIRNSIIE